MSVLLNIIKEKFGAENSFSARDLHLITKINFKVIQMCLKKMHNKEILYSNQKYGIYQLKTDEEILKDKIKVNELIDKYNLDNKKYIL